MSWTALPMTTFWIFLGRRSDICDVGCVDAGPLREGIIKLELLQLVTHMKPQGEEGGRQIIARRRWTENVESIFRRMIQVAFGIQQGPRTRRLSSLREMTRIYPCRGCRGWISQPPSSSSSLGVVFVG
jgi:hypothetical protein